jgi:hypothetical protein
MLIFLDLNAFFSIVLPNQLSSTLHQEPKGGMANMSASIRIPKLPHCEPLSKNWARLPNGADI